MLSTLIAKINKIKGLIMRACHLACQAQQCLAFDFFFLIFLN